MSRPAMEAVYVVRVISRGNEQGTLPSERRYSATTVGGLAVVHAILAMTLLLLAALHVAFVPAAHTTPEVEIANGNGWEMEAGSLLVTLSASSWVITSVCITIGPVITGVLSWKQWYLEANLRRFLAASAVAFAVSTTSTAITSAALLLQPHIHRAVARSEMFNGYNYKPLEIPPVVSPCDFVNNAQGLPKIPCNASAGDSTAPPNPKGASSPRYITPSIAVNAAVAAALEVLACLASLRVAWAGVKRTEDSKDFERPLPSPAETLPPIRVAPDIVPCESTREYEERMRRFVADAGVNPETIGR
ncbi:uncharacterized protein [Hetaerina americana]|uniref:uncharacterized protein n=1 Tax=Hetaerina americana TaxID=62018 RepID=UPI003A7F34F2